MMRSTALLAPLAIGLALAVGCQSPPPAINIFRPYGAVQVPPPGTHSLGQPGAAVQYYQRGAGGGGRKVSQATTGDPSSTEIVSRSTIYVGDSASGDGESNAASAKTGVKLASHQEPAHQDGGGKVVAVGFQSAASKERPIRIVEPGSSSGQKAESDLDSSNLSASPAAAGATAGGMHLNDATKLREPELFNAPPKLIEISQLPAATRYTPGVMSRLRGVAQPQAKSSATTAGSSQPVTVGSVKATTNSGKTTATGSTPGWKAKGG